MNEKNGGLSVQNTNGLNDPYGPVKVSVETDTIHWVRNEEGQQVRILLVRSDSLPATCGYKLPGLWRMESASGTGPIFEASDAAAESNSFIFLRWDSKFIIGSGKGRFKGVYNVNGHRPELEFIPYGDDLTRNFWEIEFSEDAIRLNYFSKVVGYIKWQTEKSGNIITAKGNHCLLCSIAKLMLTAQSCLIYCINLFRNMLKATNPLCHLSVEKTLWESDRCEFIAVEDKPFDQITGIAANENKSGM